jgi:hypothetical protein
MKKGGVACPLFFSLLCLSLFYYATRHTSIIICQVIVVPYSLHVTFSLDPESSSHPFLVDIFCWLSRRLYKQDDRADPCSIIYERSVTIKMASAYYFLIAASFVGSVTSERYFLNQATSLDDVTLDMTCSPPTRFGGVGYCGPEFCEAAEKWSCTGSDKCAGEYSASHAKPSKNLIN